LEVNVCHAQLEFKSLSSYFFEEGLIFFDDISSRSLFGVKLDHVADVEKIEGITFDPFFLTSLLEPLKRTLGKIEEPVINMAGSHEWIDIKKFLPCDDILQNRQGLAYLVVKDQSFAFFNSLLKFSCFFHGKLNPLAPSILTNLIV
jgi:hypothetical protein